MVNESAFVELYLESIPISLLPKLVESVQLIFADIRGREKLTDLMEVV